MIMVMVMLMMMMTVSDDCKLLLKLKSGFIISAKLAVTKLMKKLQRTSKQNHVSMWQDMFQIWRSTKYSKSLQCGQGNDDDESGG